MCTDYDRSDENRLTSRRDVIRAGVGAALLTAIPASVRANLTRYGTEPDGRYLDAAVRAGRWIRATAIAAPGGTTWPAVPPDAKTAQRNLYSGSPGVVLFLLELHRATGDRAWLSLATAGADHLAASLPDAVSEDEGAGLYTGLAGVAFTLDETARASGQSRYQTAAAKALGAIGAAARDVGSGVEWSDTTDIISGNAGIGLYLLAASSRGNAAARQLAVRAGRRLLEREYRTGDASLWMMSPSFTRNMPNFSHGTAGIAYFLATLARETRDKAFVYGATRGARYLQSVATPVGGEGRLIFHTYPDGRDL